MKSKEFIPTHINEDQMINEVPLPPDWDPQEFQQSKPFKTRLKYALDRAKKIGTGSSRVAMIIDYEGRPTVLKVAKNQKGMAQNEQEVNILNDGYASQLGIMIPMIDFDHENPKPTWLQTELAQKANEKTLCNLIKCDDLFDLVHIALKIAGKYKGWDRRSVQDVVQEMRLKGKTQDDIDTMMEYADKLADLANSFNVELGDFTRAANWGIYKGKPVILDVGFTTEVLQQYYSR